MSSKDETGPGVSASLQRLAAHGLELVQLRLALLGSELEAEKLRVLSALLQAVLALFFVGAALVLLSLAVVLLSPPEWRWLAAVLLGLVDAAIAYGLWRRARAGISAPGGLFAGSLAELARDRDSLGGDRP